MKTKVKIGLFIVLIISFLFYGFIKFGINVEKEIVDETTKKGDIEDKNETNKESKETLLEREVNTLIKNMTLEEKVAQLFVVCPEALMDDVGCVTAAGEMTKNAFNDIPVGGFIYLSENLESESQVKEMLSNVQLYSMDRIGVPAFLCIDEEGGSVARLGGSGRFDIPPIENMSEIGQNSDYERAKEVGNIIGKSLANLGFNVDFAPVADVLTNSENEVVKLRAFGNDAKMVSDMALLVKEGLEEEGVLATYKHFPGHGATAGDTHAGYAYSNCTLEELKGCELIPFEAGIKAGISFVMVGHISFPNILGDDTPASLSQYIIEDLLRNQMQYDGIVITDAMNMGAIAQQNSSSEAAVKAIQAGVDVILMPEDFKSAYQGVIDAVNNNMISKARIDQSLKRILSIKVEMKN